MPRLPEPVPAEVAQLAEQHQLGFLIDAFIVARDRKSMGSPKDCGHRVYAYEVGLVHKIVGHPLYVMRWEWFNRVEQSITHHHTNSAYNGTTFRYVLHSPNHGSATFTDWYKDPQHSFIDEHHNDVRYARYLRDGVAGIWRQQVMDSLTALERGETLTFGAVSLDAGGIRTQKKGKLAWSDVKDVALDQKYLVINKRGKLLAFAMVPYSLAPEATLIATLATHLATRR